MLEVRVRWFLEDTKIERLKVLYGHGHDLEESTVPNGHQALRCLPVVAAHLTSMKLQHLCIDPLEFGPGISRFNNTLATLELWACSSTTRPRLPAQSKTSWDPILIVLQNTRNLFELHLGNLQTDQCLPTGYTHDPVPRHLQERHPMEYYGDEDMTVRAPWKTKGEVTKGLHSLLTRYQFSIDDHWHTLPRVPGEDPQPKRHYLNLRYANFEVDRQRYEWTKFEAWLIRWFRSTPGYRNIIDDPTIFPVSEASKMKMLNNKAQFYLARSF
jgi:hypothetical protein